MKFSLGIKLFLSYLAIVLVGMVALGGTAFLFAPAALDRHIAQMQTLMQSPALAEDLRLNFYDAIGEILTVSTMAAIAAAAIISVFVTQRIVKPVRQIMEASARIAAGDYRHRVEVHEEDELGQLARTYNQMAERLGETEERRLELIGNVAHELRTPLSSIQALMEGLIDGVLAQESSTYLDVQHEISRLQRLVDDLQELSRAEAGQIRFSFQATDLEKLLQAAVERLSPQYEDKQVRLELDLPPTLPSIMADPDRITQVILNLLGNALQYTSETGTVIVRVEQEGAKVLLSVHDTGIGIDREQLPHIFERFYRVDKSRSRAGGGSGIGLTIARYLVEAHQGQIYVESPGINHGSTFVVELPVLK